ncbi:MAG: hypothetical protein EAZ08_06955 [Cytophagales bacterium]|nr:MAG: hypothetical protein EAZ08_06955 [Cytophagales bacterium]
MKKIVLALFALTFYVSFACAQGMYEFGYNINSLRPIHVDDQAFRNTIWYRIDLSQEANQPMFAKDLEITRIIVEAVKAGILRPFQNDSLTIRMPYEDFITNLAIANTSKEYSPTQITLLEVREDIIYSKKDLRFYHDIQAINLYIPAHLHSSKKEKFIATFSWKEIVKNVFEDNPQAVWFNKKDNNEHLPLLEAFNKRLFKGYLVSNPYIDEKLKQEKITENNNSICNIPVSQQLFRKTVWYRIDLSKPANKPMFTKHNEITKIIMEAVIAGVLRPFTNDSLEERMSYYDFMHNLRKDQSSDDEYYMPQDISLLEVREEFIFDKSTLKICYDIQSLTLYVPAEKTQSKVKRKIASFSYKELHENIFKNNTVWYNDENQAKLFDLNEGLYLRLFEGEFLKFKD